MFQETIAAISTPLQDGAISIIRMSGDQAIEIANSIFDKDLSKKESHTITYGFIMDQGEPVDEVLVSLFRAPKTYTREDIVEINAHGGRFVTRKILALLLAHGAKLAEPGEFTARAFYNGRIDLSQAEAVNDLIEARNDNAASMAIYGIRGSVRKMLEPLIQKILDIIANIEVNIDYPEYDDVEDLTANKLLPMTNEWLEEIEKILKKAQTGQLLKNGINTVILGKPNVGKSSLLNALLEEDKAIVTDIPGTTRDIVEGAINLHGLQLNLIDTAGIRESKDVVEQIGIEKSRQKLEEADLVLLLVDGSQPLDEADQQLIELVKDKKHLILFNKADQALEKEEGKIWISAQNNDLKQLVDALEKMYEQNELKEQAILSNERQIGLLMQSHEAMMKAKQAMEMDMEPDLIEIDIQSAYTHLKEILGEVSRDDLLDTLFSNFCLGK
jgi:tRNA modification GTPase